MTNTKENILTVKPEDKKMMNSVIWRSMTAMGGYQWEKQQALAFLYTMIPVINRYYKNPKDRIEAYKRHWELFNTTPQVVGFITGVATSMEKEAAENPDYDVISINAVKVSLMGPLAGIGDSIFWGSLKVIATGIAVSFGLAGSILGPLLYFIVFNIPSTLARHLLPVIGYNMGTSFLQDAEENGIMQFLTKAATIVGLMTVGGMTYLNISTKFAYQFSMNGSEFYLQSILDGIAPGILPLSLVLGCMYLLKKKNVSPVVLIVILLVSCIVLHGFGIV